MSHIDCYYIDTTSELILSHYAVSGWLNDQQLKTVYEKPSISQYSLKMLGLIETCTLVFILQNYFQTTGSIKCYICNIMKQNTVQVSKNL